MRVLYKVPYQYQFFKITEERKEKKRKRLEKKKGKEKSKPKEKNEAGTKKGHEDYFVGK